MDNKELDKLRIKAVTARDIYESTAIADNDREREAMDKADRLYMEARLLLNLRGWFKQNKSRSRKGAVFSFVNGFLTAQSRIWQRGKNSVCCHGAFV